MKNEYYQPLLPNRYYHIFNRAVGNEKLFFSTRNYEYFLRRMQYYLLPIATIYAYSLMPNHFHLLLKIKDTETLIEKYEQKKKRKFVHSQTNLSTFVMQQLKNWLSGYAMAINKQNERKGALFIDYLKRISPESTEDLRLVTAYIHRNAIHHHLTSSYGQWRFDSYLQPLKNDPGKFGSKEMLGWFGRADAYDMFHQEYAMLIHAESV